MNVATLSDDMRSVFERWNGKTWFVPEPDDFVRGLYTLTQLQAHYILKHGRDLTNWEAEVAQRAFYSHKPANAGVHFWLDKMERDKCPEVVA